MALVTKYAFLGVIEEVNTNVLRENHAHSPVCPSACMRPIFSDWTIKHVYLTTKLQKTRIYLSDYKKRISPPHYRKHVPVHQNTEHLYLSAEL